MEVRTNHRQRLLDRGRGFKPRGKNSFCDGMRGHENVCRHLFDSCYPRKPQAQETQKWTEQAVRPRWERREGPALERGCISTFFFCLSWEAPCLCFVLSALCALCFPKLFFYPGDHFSAKLKDMREDVDQVAEVRNRRASIFSSITLLKMARTSNTRFGRSANALG